MRRMRLPERRDAVHLERIVRAALPRAGGQHAAELDRLERLAVQAHPGLTEEERAGVENRVEQEKQKRARRDDGQEQHAHDDVDPAFRLEEAARVPGRAMAGRGGPLGHPAPLPIYKRTLVTHGVAAFRCDELETRSEPMWRAGLSLRVPSLTCGSTDYYKKVNLR